MNTLFDNLKGVTVDHNGDLKNEEDVKEGIVYLMYTEYDEFRCLDREPSYKVRVLKKVNGEILNCMTDTRRWRDTIQDFVDHSIAEINAN